MSLQTIAVSAQQDPYLWLEEVDGVKAMDFVKTNNSKTFDQLKKNPKYTQLYNQSLTIINSKARIVYPSVTGEYV